MKFEVITNNTAVITIENRLMNGMDLMEQKLISVETALPTTDDLHLLAKSFRILAFFGVILAVFSAITTALMIPVLYSYAQYTVSLLEPEIDYCFGQSRLLLSQLIQIHETNGVKNRKQRQVQHHYEPSSFQSSDRSIPFQEDITYRNIYEWSPTLFSFPYPRSGK
uniref:Col_cuticle_N domain-containing protein n=1 Tax=Elaeophora elaphi TaxID=1147741 RepID=A0A0R3S5F1_9BILA